MSPAGSGQAAATRHRVQVLSRELESLAGDLHAWAHGTGPRQAADSARLTINRMVADLRSMRGEVVCEAAIRDKSNGGGAR